MPSSIVGRPGFVLSLPVKLGLRQNKRRCHPRILCKKTTQETASASSFSSPGTLRTAVAVGTFLFCGVTNRVVYKMALVPMRDYIFFLAQFLSLVYVAVYVPILFIRYRMGIVTAEMLAIPKSWFVIIGICEALATLLLLICTSRLPGIILPVLQQLFLLWQLVTSSILLGRRYAVSQVAGVLCVMMGSVLAATATAASISTGEASIPYMLLMNVVFMLYSVSVVAKEKIFEDAKSQLGQNLDVFVVNSFGSIAQALGVLILFPLLLRAKQMPLTELPRYLTESVSCFCGHSLSPASDCSGAPLLPLTYIIINLIFNVSGLYLIRTIGTLSVGLSASFIVPVTVAVFSLPLPYLGAGSRLSLRFLLGCATLIMGMLIYSAKDMMEFQKRRKNH